jgi:hypothetical protein
MRRAAMALRECGSSDIFTATRAVLEAAIRSESDLIELLSPDTAATSALPRRTDVVRPGRLVSFVPIPDSSTAANLALSVEEWVSPITFGSSAAIRS